MWGLNAVVLMLLTKIIFSVGHLGFYAIEKNAQHLQIGIHQNSTQHVLVDRKQQQKLYMS